MVLKKRTKRLLTVFIAALLTGVLCGLWASADTKEVHDGDLMVVEAEKATVDQTVEGDLLGAATEMVVSGHVKGSIRVAAMSLSLSGKVERNVTVAAMELKTAKTLNAEDVVILASMAEIYGSFESLTVYADRVVIGGTVTGELICEAEQIVILEGASFHSAKFISPNEPMVVKGISSGDSVRLSKSVYADKSVFEQTPSDFLLYVMSLLYAIPASILLALLMAWLLQKKTGGLSLCLRSRPVPFMLKGLALLFGLPMAALFLLAMPFTMSIGGVILLLMLLVGIAAEAVTACMLGRMFLPAKSPYLSASVFAAGLCLISSLPYAGMVVTAVEMAIAFGSLFTLLFSRGKNAPQGDGVDFRL